MSDPQTPDLHQALESLEEIKQALESLNSSPNVAPLPVAPVTAPVVQGVENQATPAFPRVMSTMDQLEIRSKLRTKSVRELHTMFALQSREQNSGIPFDVWASAGGYTLQSALSRSDNPMLIKALDSSGASALIRQDLEPLLYELFVRQFPAWERFSKEPANGLVHAFNQVTEFGDAKFMTELGTVSDDESVYQRATTPISVIATRRGVSLKSQFATLAGGAGFNPEQLELTGGLRAVAHRMQVTIFQGNATASGGTAATEDGLYDANAFDGLRKILNQAQAKNVDPFAGTPEDMRGAIDDAATSVMDGGGQVSVVYTSATNKTLFDKQQDKNVRYIDTQVPIIPGVLTNAVNTIFGPLPLVPVPGDSIGTYAISGPQTVGDMYLLDESSISLPFLGSDGPTVLDIPIGISGQLTHLFIIFGMWGLAVKAVPFSNKVRVFQS
jgi:hypothetical protein